MPAEEYNFVQVCSCTSGSMRPHLQKETHVCTLADLRIHVFVCTQECTQTKPHTHTHTHTYIYIYIYIYHYQEIRKKYYYKAYIKSLFG